MVAEDVAEIGACADEMHVPIARNMTNRRSGIRIPFKKKCMRPWGFSEGNIILPKAKELACSFKKLLRKTNGATELCGVQHADG
jgi:hypothetical protein